MSREEQRQNPSSYDRATESNRIEFGRGEAEDFVRKCVEKKAGNLLFDGRIG